MCFLLADSRCFLLSAAFSWSNWDQYLLESVIWFSGGSLWFPSSSTIYTASPLDEDWPLVSCSTISSVLYYCIVSTFHCLSHILSFSLFEIVPFVRECSRWRSLGPGHWFYELFTWYLLTVHLLSSKSIHNHKPCLLLLQIWTTKLYLTSLLIKKLNSNFCSPVVKVKMKVLSCVWFFATPWTVACQAPPSMDFPGKNTGMDCHFLLQGIFPTQGLPHCRQTLYSLSHQGIYSLVVPLL